MSQSPTKKGEGILTPLRFALLCCFLLTILTVVLLRPQAPSSRLRRPRTFFAESESSTGQPSTVEGEYGLTEVKTEIPQSVGDDKGVTTATEPAKRPWFMWGGEHRPDRHDPHSKLFPEDAPGEDRIINQLMYTLPKDENVPVKKILLANGLGAWGLDWDPLGRVWFFDNKCPVDQCSFTGDQDDAPTADAILFKDHFIRNMMRFSRRPAQVWIIYYLESPVHTEKVALPYKDVFNWTATYRRDADIVTPYEKWVYHGRDPLITEKEQNRNYAANKTKKRERQEECILSLETFPALTEGFMSEIEGRIEETMTVIEKYVIILYYRSSLRSAVNKCRKYLLTRKHRQLEQLPPTKAALHKHFLRAVFQGFHVWGQLSVTQDQPSLSDWGGL